MNSITKLSEILLSSLFQQNVRFVHWKSNIRLYDSLSGKTDFDLLIHSEDKEVFFSVLKDVGFLKIKSQKWASYPGVEDWLGFDEETTKFLHLHVHFNVITGVKRVKHLFLPWELYMLKTSIKHPSGWPILNPDLESILLFVRIWAKMPLFERFKRNPHIPSEIKKELRWLLLQTKDENLLSTLTDLGIHSSEKFLEEISQIKSGLDKPILSISCFLYAQLRKFYRMEKWKILFLVCLRYLGWLKRRFISKFFKKVVFGKTFYGEGVMIALIGSDGAGKSTLSKELNNWLKYKLDSHEIYLGAGNGNVGVVNKFRKLIVRMRLIFNQNKVVKKRVYKADKIQVVNVDKNSHVRKLYKLFDLHLIYRKIKALKSARIFVKRGSIILTDRYPQTQFNGINDGLKLQNNNSYEWAAKIEKRLFNQALDLGPDLVIKLLVSPEVAIKRKPDHSFEEITKKCKIVKQLMFLQCETVVIDADKTFEQVLFEAKISIWKHIKKMDDEKQHFN